MQQYSCLAYVGDIEQGGCIDFFFDQKNKTNIFHDYITYMGIWVSMHILQKHFQIVP